MALSTKIAVVGSGISGLALAYSLSKTFQVKLFEKQDRFGGHSNTINVNLEGRSIPVDTGFIVFNTKNYPNLTSLFNHLKITTKLSDMSFGFSSGNGKLEYSGRSLNTLFAQRRNLLNIRFVNGLRDILRFNREAPIDLAEGKLIDLSLGDYLRQKRYGKWFAEQFILPMGGAIWSSPAYKILAFPAINFVSFFQNHGLLRGMADTLQWRTIDGGARVYVDKITKKIGSRAFSNSNVQEIERVKDGVSLRFSDGVSEKFDQVIICTHAPQAAQILLGKTHKEKELLKSFKVSKNKVVVHSDKTLMPYTKKAWSSWNFVSPGWLGDSNQRSSVTYWMNRLQGIDKSYPIFVSLNPLSAPADEAIHAEFDYYHPIFDKNSFDAQKQMDEIQGNGGVWYAGAWLGYGFHEDGLVAGLRVAKALGVEPNWAIKNIKDFIKNRTLEAAE